MRYVVGFLFDDDTTKLALILKLHPEWQRGKWNGIGGKVEYKSNVADYIVETPYEAMIREFKEETGVEFYDWTPFAVTHGPSRYDKDNWEVHYFKAFSTDAQNKIRWTIDEVPSVFRIEDIPINLVSHNNWLIPMALNSKDTIFHIIEEMR